MATLLIVEDDKKTNEAICEYLKSAGQETIPAYDGAEAIQIFRKRQIDLAVLDIMLPKMTGLAVLHEIRRISPLPVLMLTAIEDEYTQVQSFDEQADDYITKPFSMVLLGKTGHGVSAEKRAKQPAGYDDVRGCNRRLFRIYSLGSKMKSVCWPAISTVYIKTC